MLKPQMAEQPTDSKNEDDLTTILNQSQREDLTLLIANITGSMRTKLLQNFDAAAALDRSFSQHGLSEEEKLMRVDPKVADVEAMDRQRKLKEEYEKDLSSARTKQLKKDCLRVFEEWREQVLLRVGEVVNSKTTAKKQLESATSNNLEVETPATIGIRSEGLGRGTSPKFKELYPPVKNPLTKLSMEQRTLVLHSVLLLLLSLKHYNAPSRVLLLLLTSSLKLPLRTFEQDEYATGKGLLEGAKEMTAKEETLQKVEEHKDSLKWKVGLATVAGAALIGVTGGLAAPLVAAGVGTVMGGLGLGATSAATYLGSVAGSTYLIGGLFGAYGGRMTGSMMDNYAREVEDFEFLPVHGNNKTSEDEKLAVKQASDHDHKLRVSICISGWLTEKEEVLRPWRVLGTGAEVFALKYELETMLNLGNAMNGFVQSAAWGYAQKQIIARTIFAELAASLWPLGLLKAAKVIDNPFSLAKRKSKKAGEVLADALINKAQGERPVTLIGYSLGARVIYSCLMQLAKRKAFGLVENAVLVGAPSPSDTHEWRMLRAVVSGRLVNVYSENDYVLGFMYRTSSLQYGVAGLQPVQGLTGVENVDVSEEVSGHLRYRYLVGSILKKIGFEDVEMQAVEEEKVALARMEEEEEEKSLQAQQKRMLRRQTFDGEEDEGAEAEYEASEIEKEVQKKTQKSMLTKAIDYFHTSSTPTTQGVTTTQKESNEETHGTSASAWSHHGHNLAQRAYSVLPSLPHMGDADSHSNVEATSQPKGQSLKGENSASTAQSYTSRAAGYLPSMHMNLPSMHSLSYRSKVHAEEQSGTTQKGKEGEQAKDSHKSNPDVAEQATTDRLKQTSSVLQANPQDTLASSVEKAQRREARNGVQPSSATKLEQKAQSYASQAVSYLPSVPVSMPSMPIWSSIRKPAPKLDQRDNPSIKSSLPKLERKESSQVKSPPPKLERRSTSGIKSSPPKLGPRKTISVANPSNRTHA